MNDIIESMKRAYVRDGWLLNAILFRLGNPFYWADYEHDPEQTFLSGTPSFLRFIFLFHCEYPTPDNWKCADYDSMKSLIEAELLESCEHFLPRPTLSQFPVADAVKRHALVRVQDYAFIRTFCKDLPKNLNHLDIGAGLGTHGIYSLNGFDSNYFAVEAVPNTYALQRLFLRFLARKDNHRHLDIIDYENFGIEQSRMAEDVNHPTRYKIRHIPSWYLRLVNDNSIDLVTATWTLNEVTGSALLWLLSNASRTLKEGGYFYIRDANVLHPGSRSIDYDGLLIKMGFTERKRMNFTNRVDFFGVPRLFQKTTSRHFSFNDLVDISLGEFAQRAQGEIHLPSPAPFENDYAKPTVKR